MSAERSSRPPGRQGQPPARVKRTAVVRPDLMFLDTRMSCGRDAGNKGPSWSVQCAVYDYISCVTGFYMIVLPSVQPKCKRMQFHLTRTALSRVSDARASLALCRGFTAGCSALRDSKQQQTCKICGKYYVAIHVLRKPCPYLSVFSGVCSTSGAAVASCSHNGGNKHHSFVRKTTQNSARLSDT